MNKTIFYNNPVFRLTAPLLSGIIIYLLILMFFDSVDMIAMNFFSREVLFTIGLTYVFFELNRLVVILVQMIRPGAPAFLTRLLLQYVLALLTTTVAISLILYLYFVNVEGFGTITTELITFNGIFLFAALFYHLYYFSIHFLYKQNDALLLEEKVIRNNLEHELSKFKNQINPTFLFQALEIIITELHTSKKHADELIGHLAAIYRYTLDNQQNELTELRYELESLLPAGEIFRTCHPQALFIHEKVTEKKGVYLVPGTLLTVFEHAVIDNLISTSIPLHFTIKTSNGTLTVVHSLNERIVEHDGRGQRIANLAKAYGHFTDKPFRTYSEEQKQFYEIPLLVVEEE